MATEKNSAMKKHHSGPQTIPFLVDPNGWWNLHLQWLDWHFSRTLIQTTRCSLPNNHDPGLFLLDRLFIDVPSSICPDVQGFQSMGSLLPLFFGNPMPSLWLSQFPSQEIHEEFTKHFTRHGQGMIYWVPQIPVTSQRGPNFQFLQMTPNLVGFILCSSASQLYHNYHNHWVATGLLDILLLLSHDILRNRMPLNIRWYAMASHIPFPMIQILWP